MKNQIRHGDSFPREAPLSWRGWRRSIYRQKLKDSTFQLVRRDACMDGFLEILSEGDPPGVITDKAGKKWWYKGPQRYHKKPTGFFTNIPDAKKYLEKICPRLHPHA